MRIEFQTRRIADLECDLLACPVFENQEKETLRALNKATEGVVASVLQTGEFKPEMHRTCLIHHPAHMKARRLLLIGAGVEGEFTLARLREVAGIAARAARQARGRKIGFWMRGDFAPADLITVSVEGLLNGNYESEIYKTRDIETRSVEHAILVADAKVKKEEAEDGISRGTIVGHAVNLARNLGNEPANVLTPAKFAEIAEAEGSRAGLEVEVLERADMEKLGMNAVLAVARGSAQPPKLIVLRIPGQKGAQGEPLFALVGKGVTFDSGGISIKPADKMEDMKDDMAGGAAVLGAMSAIAELGARHAVIGLIPLVENLPGGNATKPGDIVKSLSGKTIEIINTDAEGRLILADTMAYARTLGAARLIDIATLTGAVVVALGQINAGMMGTDQQIMERLRAAGRITGEKFWPLPLDEEYRKSIRSEIADIKNIGNRWGGAITAGKFLQEFAEKTPWVHLDIAGVNLDHDGQPFAAKGATGFGVRSLVHLMTQNN